MTEVPSRLATPAMAMSFLGALPARTASGVPTGGQFAITGRPETGTALPPEFEPDDPARFGPNGVHVQGLLDLVADRTPAQAAALGAHAPIVTLHGRTVEMFCPNADAVAYGNLARYRRITRAHADDANPGPLHDEVARAMVEVELVAADLPIASKCAVRDAAVALVTAGKVHAIAYDTLTRAVRQAFGSIHPGDGPVRG